MDTVSIQTINGVDSLAEWAQIVMAFGTLLLAAIAIWGEAIRHKLMPPKLTLMEHNFSGDFTKQGDRKRVVYFHLRLVNERSWAPAHNVRVMCEAISRRTADGSSFREEPLIVPMQLTWSFQRFNEMWPTIGFGRCLDFGYLSEGDDQFAISLFAFPGNFRGFVCANETKRFKILARSDDHIRSDPMFVEVSWDGVFPDSAEDCRSHIVVKTVDSLS